MKKNKNEKEKKQDFLAQEAEEFKETAPEYTLDIPEDEIWTYQIEGLAAPRIGKPVKNASTKKLIMIISLVIAIGLSIYLSILAIHHDTYDYAALKDGTYMLEKFSNPGDINVMSIDFVDGDTSKPVTQIREYAFNCDETIMQISIGAEVKSIQSTSFYSCQALQRILVDENNPYYRDIDGVLYNKNLTELICYPIDHDEYLRHKFGYDDITVDNDHSIEDIVGSSDKYNDEFLKKYNDEIRTYVIPSTVTTIKTTAMNYADITALYLPQGLKTIESLAVFRCTALKDIYSYITNGTVTDTSYTATENMKNVDVSLPDGLEYIGSDAFSYNQELTYMYIPESVTYIGHHAFWDTCYKQDGEIKGVSEMNVAAEESSFNDKTYTGDQWCPKYDYRLFKKTIPVNYSALRQQH